MRYKPQHHDNYSRVLFPSSLPLDLNLLSTVCRPRRSRQEVWPLPWPRYRSTARSARFTSLRWLRLGRLACWLVCVRFLRLLRPWHARVLSIESSRCVIRFRHFRHGGRVETGEAVVLGMYRQSCFRHCHWVLACLSTGRSPLNEKYLFHTG